MAGENGRASQELSTEQKVNSANGLPEPFGHPVSKPAFSYTHHSLNPPVLSERVSCHLLRMREREDWNHRSVCNRRRILCVCRVLSIETDVADQVCSGDCHKPAMVVHGISPLVVPANSGFRVEKVSLAFALRAIGVKNSELTRLAGFRPGCH